MHLKRKHVHTHFIKTGLHCGLILIWTSYSLDEIRLIRKAYSLVFLYFVWGGGGIFCTSHFDFDVLCISLGSSLTVPFYMNMHIKNLILAYKIMCLYFFLFLHFEWIPMHDYIRCKSQCFLFYILWINIFSVILTDTHLSCLQCN